MISSLMFVWVQLVPPAEMRAQLFEMERDISGMLIEVSSSLLTPCDCHL